MWTDRETTTAIAAAERLRSKHMFKFLANLIGALRRETAAGNRVHGNFHIQEETRHA